jgi:trimethylamine--corrinoid protein Co-methyltransferase
MRPVLRFLSDDLIREILSEARDLLCKIGMKIYHEELLSLLYNHGALVDYSSKNVIFTNDIIDNALKTAPSSFRLYDVKGNQTHDFSHYHVYFTPGSSSLNFFDAQTNGMRKPKTSDFIRCVKLTSRLKYLTSQSTAFIPADVNENIADSYRLYLCLLHGEKPVVTGTFNDEGFAAMKKMQVAVRGTEEALKEKPLTIFSCCPTTPLKWSEHTCADIMSCARSGIPVELISMPLAGFTGPVTLVGSLVEHTAETLSGIVISQLTQPGAPLLYGGAPAAFDVRCETTPMGAVETQMMDCAYNEIGKYLNIPTQAYIALSDAKSPDAQAGLETSMGAVLAALSGINSISGPGMMDFINCFSLEKLVLDNEICGMVSRLVEGVQPREDFPAVPRFEELLKEQHLLISKHTRRYLRQEHYFPGPVIDRASHERWQEQGSLSLLDRARKEVERLIGEYEPSSLAAEVKKELTCIMEAEARRCGMETLPDCN